ncbi:hypothetical protein ACHAWF_004284 [Thalassiosira exigua]
MPHRVAFGSCSHPSLPQPLWGPIRARRPAAFVWGGDAIYADRHAGFDWTAVGRRGTFPPPTIHVEATPGCIREQYEEQWGVEDYRRFVGGWAGGEDDADGGGGGGGGAKSGAWVDRPVIFGTIDDHDYGQNNGDHTYQYKRESNLAFVDFLYCGTTGDDNCTLDVYCGIADDSTCTPDVIDQPDVCEVGQEMGILAPREETARENDTRPPLGRHKLQDPMYRRALEGKGVYGVQLFDFSRKRSSSEQVQNDNILWGGGHWVPEEEARIDPDVIGNLSADSLLNETDSSYSTTHSVAIFVLDVRSNKSPWPKGKHTPTPVADASDVNATNAIRVPELDFLGQHQWEWFEAALANSRATVNVIVSGLQVHPDRYPDDGNILEEWSKFPEARKRLYDAILNSGARSPLLVSGDVHMSQVLRKDCARASDVRDMVDLGVDRRTTAGRAGASIRRRSLVEITTSGMTHSWGTSFSSQPKNHRYPMKPYSYFVSQTFMTICHLVCPWNDILIRNADDVKRDDYSREGTYGRRKPRVGKQYYLGLNFLELEFRFPHGEQSNKLNEGGDVTARIFGAEANEPPELELRWTFDQLSGNADPPEATATFQDFATVGRGQESYANPMREDQDWICVPYRGFAPTYHEYASRVVMFVAFCSLFFFPHAILVLLLVAARKKWRK